VRLITANPALSMGIQQILGTQGTVAPTPGSGGLSGCLVTGNLGHVVGLSVDKRPEAAAAFKAFQTQPGATTVAGLGDAAFTTTNQLGSVIVSVLKGNVVVGATVPKTIAGGFASPLDAAKALATALLTSVGG